MTTLPRRRLAGTDVKVTLLGLGAAPLGNLYEPVTDEGAAATIATALELGIRTFDAAPHYGLGLAEHRLGAALPEDRDIVVSTKVGRLLDPVPGPVEGMDDQGFAVPATHRRRWDFSAAGIGRSLEESLERLGREHVEILLLHDPDDYLDEAVREGIPALVQLREDGLVRAIGAGMNHAGRLTRLVATGLLDVVLLAGRYTLLEQGALDDLLPAALRTGTSVIAGGVFNSGLLARHDVPDDATYDYRRADRTLVARARAIASVCDEYGISLPAAAVHLPLAHPAVAAVVVGMRTPAEVAADVEMVKADVACGLWARLQAEGLLRADVPVPVP